MKLMKPFLHLYLSGCAHPIEFGLCLPLVLSFINAFIHCPTFWAPATFVKEYDIQNDISLCSSRVKSGKHPMCPLVAGELSKVVPNKFNEPTNLSNYSLHGSYIQRGGSFNPSICRAVHQAIILLPYRNRETQLKIFLQNMHPFLMEQNINYTIVVIERVDELPFNRGKLFNVGFTEMVKINGDCCCFIFHDVDLLPEISSNMYTCSKNPRHMSPFVNTLRYNLMYRGLFGGVIAMKRGQFKSINGFSNLFYGWGGEDDDLSARVTKAGLTITRWPYSVSRYFMVHHKKEKPSEEKDLLLDEVDVRSANDGLSSLKYRLVSITEEVLYTKIQVEF